MDEREHPNDQLVRVRWDTYLALRRIRDDAGAGTFDRAIREALRLRYPFYSTDL